MRTYIFIYSLHQCVSVTLSNMVKVTLCIYPEMRANNANKAIMLNLTLSIWGCIPILNPDIHKHTADTCAHAIIHECYMLISESSSLLRSIKLAEHSTQILSSKKNVGRMLSRHIVGSCCCERRQPCLCVGWPPMRCWLRHFFRTGCYHAVLMMKICCYHACWQKMLTE
jgi:hypothetical protein